MGGERQASLYVKGGRESRVEQMDSHCKARREILHSMEALMGIPTLTVLGGESHQTYTDRTGRRDGTW